jgi:hypothetical protein
VGLTEFQTAGSQLGLGFRVFCFLYIFKLFFGFLLCFFSFLINDELSKLINNGK